MSDEDSTLRWRSLRRRLTVLGLAIAFVAGVITNIETIVTGVTKFGSYFTGESKPYEIKTSSLSVLPYSLKNMMPSEDLPLYWFRAKITNKGSEKLFFKVSYGTRLGKVSVDPKSEPCSVPPHYTDFECAPDPGVNFLKSDFTEDDDVVITWEIRDGHDALIDTDKLAVRVLPKNVVKWDLTAPDGSGVPRDFLLASLTAWTLTSEPEIKEHGEWLRKGTIPTNDPALSARRWFARSYTALFHGSRAQQISPMETTFPPPGRQTIRTPSQVLAEGESNPLEAALLLAALTRTAMRKPALRVALFVLAEPGGTPGPTVLLSWSTGLGDWQALDMTRVTPLSFDDNEKQASARLKRLFGEAPGMLEALGQRGVLIGGTWPVVALDFAVAKEQFHIRGLP